MKWYLNKDAAHAAIVALFDSFMFEQREFYTSKIQKLDKENRLLKEKIKQLKVEIATVQSLPRGGDEDSETAL